VVGLWHFNSDSGTDALDSSRLHNDGTLRNGAGWVAGARGNALNLDGFDDHVDIPYVAEYDCPDGVTVMALVRWSVDPATGNPYAAIVSTGEHQYILQHSGLTPPGPGINEFFEFAVETDQGRNYSWSSSYVAPNIWYHVTGVYDPLAEEIRLYVNGTLENVTAHNGTINTTGTLFNIGNRWHSGAHDRHFEGDIDEVVVWDRALTSVEVSRHYQSMKP
jgi:hypothetical protein